MNKFSRITGSIAFWARVIAFLGTIPIMVFQKRIMESAYPDTPNATVFLFDEVFIRFIFLLIVALFLYKKNTNNKTRAIISLYFYLFVTILFSNPIATGISIFLSSRKGPEYLAAKSVILSASQSILYIFTLASNVCFYLSTGSLIASNDDGNQNIKIESDISEKSRTKLVLYSGFLGIFGIDR
ncbi:MAG: hypothetical protein J5817_01715, partial [Treponema sp.]|nr:hypothetical protein [Treponema sp.]